VVVTTRHPARSAYFLLVLSLTVCSA
jgi:hypothetical protein